MYEEGVEVIVHLLLLAGYTMLAGALAVGGLFIEYQGYVVALAGDPLLALWIGGIGAIFLVLAYFVLRDKVVPEVVRLRTFG